MKNLLFKTLEIMRDVFWIVVAALRRLIELLRSVNIDQPRGVLLCLAFQVAILAVCLKAFHRGDARVEQSGEQPSSNLPPVVIESAGDEAQPAQAIVPDPL